MYGPPWMVPTSDRPTSAPSISDSPWPKLRVPEVAKVSW